MHHAVEYVIFGFWPHSDYYKIRVTDQSAVECN